LLGHEVAREDKAKTEDDPYKDGTMVAHKISGNQTLCGAVCSKDSGGGKTVFRGRGGEAQSVKRKPGWPRPTLVRRLRFNASRIDDIPTFSPFPANPFCYVAAP